MLGKKLELQWTNKGKALYYDLESGKYEWVHKKDPRVSEPRILIEKELFGDPTTENILIKGDNLLALKALLQDYQNQIKLIFIDPPYNTGNAFEHYDDGMEHSIWLGLMKTRIESLYKLLAPDGSLWITIDDNEAHYLKILCDEVFGRKNFITSIAWQKAFAKKNKALISGSHDHILVIAKDISKWKRNLLPREGAALSTFKNPDNDSRGPWQSVNYSVQSEDAERRKQYRYPIKLPSGREVSPPIGRHWNGLPARTEELRIDNRLWFGKDGNNPPRTKLFLSEVQEGIVPDTWWEHEAAGSNQDSKKEMLDLFPGDEPFATPKPEKLLYRIMIIATSPGDLVLDSFAGSGTTGAVAHKMGRKWIMVEMNGTAETHIIPRMQKVISGKDQGGISKQTDWKGGGGFKYFELGDSLFVRDTDLRLTVINPKMYNGALIRAVLKIEGFRLFNPDNALHGISGTTIAHVTEQYLSQEYIDTLLSEIGERGKFVVIYAKTISSKLKVPENVDVKRIPDILLKKFTV